ncbi:MAG TPA: hypothetical protein VMV49_17975 [Candidatus Deferrimicrobium sp.]|nr:hypothetical protein [Candidatus Deferrimicrobium sp.]
MRHPPASRIIDTKKFGELVMKTYKQIETLFTNEGVSRATANKVHIVLNQTLQQIQDDSTQLTRPKNDRSYFYFQVG